MRYSEGSLRLLHDDLYQARYCYQMVNEEGRVIKKQVARNFHAASQKEAVLEKARIRDQLEREALIEDMLPCQKKNPKLSKFMFEQIDGMLKSGLIEPTTGAKYKSEANLILRFIDDVPVHKITAAMVRKMDQDMLAKGYARETVARAHNALKRYLYEALEKGLIIAVPITRTVKPPRVERKDPNALDDETRKRLMSILDEMPDDQITLAIRLGLGAGLRNEEVIGLKWENVDLDTGMIRIRSVISSAGGKAIEKGPKTAAGRRDIPIDPVLVEKLKTRAREVFEAERSSDLQGFYVVGDKDGVFLRPADLTRSFRRLAKEHDIYGTTGELATFYSLRHTYATMLLRAGVDAKTVASLMGHSSVAMTLNVYASTDPQARAAAGAVVADLMSQR